MPLVLALWKSYENVIFFQIDQVGRTIPTFITLQFVFFRVSGHSSSLFCKLEDLSCSKLPTFHFELNSVHLDLK